MEFSVHHTNKPLLSISGSSDWRKLLLCCYFLHLGHTSGIFNTTFLCCCPSQFASTNKLRLHALLQSGGINKGSQKDKRVYRRNFVATLALGIEYLSSEKPFLGVLVLSRDGIKLQVQSQKALVLLVRVCSINNIFTGL